MPFTSQKQRGLFYAAQKDPAVRAKTGISKGVADKMTGEDQPGKLPRYVRGGKPLPTYGATVGMRKK
jgi:hypothetical protein